MRTRLAFPLMAIIAASTGSVVAEEAAPAFGTATTVYQRFFPTDFAPILNRNGCHSPLGSLPAVSIINWDPSNGVFTYRLQTQRGDPAACNRYVTNPRLPGGALLTSVELDSCDTSTDGSHVKLNVYSCDGFGNCNPTPLATLSSANNVMPCDARTAAVSYTVNNKQGELVLDLYIDGGIAPTTNELTGVVLGYTLQVSPPPATASFDDVPTTHPFFQYIEALKAGGITGGCSASPPLYCPDDPVTRGQAAVFLSKALGLNWSQ